MEKDAQRASNNGISTTSNGRAAAADGGLQQRSASEATRQTAAAAATTSDFVLQWGTRKRPRCMKVQAKDDAAAAAHKGRVERRVGRGPIRTRPTRRPAITGTGMCTWPKSRTHTPHPTPSACSDSHAKPLGSLSPSTTHHHHHHRSKIGPEVISVIRNSENSSAMRGQSNGGLRGFSSPDRGAHDKKATNHHHPHPHHHSTTTTTTTNTNNHHHHLNSNSNSNHHHHHHHPNHHHPHHNNESNNKSAASSETAHDSKKGGGGSSSGSGDAAPPVWPPKFVIALTNKEKEEDFIIFKGSKLPQRPKKRAKVVQRTVNLVSPGAWLCDLTLERYEVREKKISKKRPRGLKAMGNMDSDSE
ncbi:homeobox protein OTX1 [Eucalyptus grandis]|uniref:homeobox protein OTX1 n=1 Tax=Eucalyptus grandis TaxID=71139 RepID=UPI00192F019C|nr:homeobox protein OTX1 [Eucalyptus grandis]